jgi:Protein of unknown function with HXXEE motif
MGVSFGLHVADEATHDFLAWYNPAARRISTFLGGLPFPPTFTFLPWLIGLLVATAILVGLTPFAFRGAPWLRTVAVVVGVINTGNGLFHLVAAAVLRRSVPGVISAPLLLASAVWLLWEV